MTLIEGLLKLGGKRWMRWGRDRIYFDFNDVMEAYCRAIGLEVERYNTGNLSSAVLRGKKISNSSARALLRQIPDKFWYDVNDGKFHTSYVSSRPGEDTSGVVDRLESYYRNQLNMRDHANA